MSTSSELERLVVRLVGEKAEYERIIEEAEQDALKAAEVIEKAAGVVEAQQRRALEEGARLTAAMATPLERYRAEMAHLDDLLARDAISQDTYNRALERSWNTLPNIAAAQDKVNSELAEAEALFKSTRTPLENYSKEMKRLDGLLAAGRISEETYNRALEQQFNTLPRVQRSQAALNKELQLAKAITEAVATPAEVYKKKVGDLDRLLARGRITQETYNRALKQLQSTLPGVNYAEEQHAESVKKVEEILQRIQTPADKYKQRLADLNRLHKEGFLTTGQYQAGLKQLTKEFSTTHAKAMLLGNSLKDVGRAARTAGSRITMGVTAPVVAFGAASIHAFSEFDNAMTEGFAIMGPISKDMQEQLEQTALGFERSKFGPEQLADGLKVLAAAGLTAEQSMDSLATVEKFATAGAFGLERATQLLTDSQSALGMVSKDGQENMRNMMRVADALVKAGDQSTASPEQFAEALANGAADARNFGMELETTMAVLDAYASKGNKGAAAGSDLARATRLIAKAARENGEAFKKFNIDVIDKATGEYKNFIDIVGDMEAAFKDLTGPQRSAALEMLGFEALAQSAILPLLGMSEQMKEWEAAQRSATGYTENVANKQMESFKNQMLALWNNITKVRIEIGKMLAPAIGYLSGLIEKGLKWWRQLDEVTKRWIVGIAGVAAVVGPALAALGVFLGVVGGLVAGIASFIALGGTTIAIIAAIVGGLALFAAEAIAVGTAIAGLVYYIVGPEGLKSAWDTAYAATVNFFTKAFGFVMNFRKNMKALFEWLPENWDRVVSDMLNLWLNYVSSMGQNLQVGIRILVRFWAAYQGWMIGRFKSLFSMEFVNAIITGVGKGLAIIGRFGKHVWEQIKAAFTGKSVNSEGFMQSLMEDFGKGMENSNLFATFGDILREESKNFVSPLTNFKSSIEEGPDFVFDLAKKTGESVGKGLEQGINQTVPQAVTKVEEAAQKVTQAFQGEMSTQEKAIDKVLAKLKEEADTYGKSKYQVEVYRLAKLGASEAQIKEAQAMADKLDAQEKEKKSMEKAAQIMDKYRKSAEKVLSPLEKFNKTQAELDKLLKDELITIDAYRYELAEARKDMNKGVKVNFKATGFDAVEAGSAEAFARMYQYQNEMQKAVDDAVLPGKAEESMVARMAPPPMVDRPSKVFGKEPLTEDEEYLYEKMLAEQKRAEASTSVTTATPTGVSNVSATTTASSAAKGEVVDTDRQMLAVLTKIEENTRRDARNTRPGNSPQVAFASLGSN